MKAVKQICKKWLASALSVVLMLGTLGVFAQTQENPFALKDAERVICSSGFRSLIIDDKELVQQVESAINCLGAKKQTLSTALPDTVSLTVSGKDWSYYYLIGTDPDSSDKGTAIWTLGNSYHTQKDFKPILTLMENERKHLDPYGYFTWNQDKACIGLLDNAARKASFVETYDRQTEILKLLQIVAPTKITAAGKSALGKQRRGVSEMRIQIDSDSYSYQLYENGLSVTRYTADGANAAEYFVCDPAVIQKLAEQMSKTYTEDQTKTSTWLAIINPARVERFNVKLKEEKYQDNILRDFYATQTLDYVRELSVVDFLGTTASVWKSPDTEFQLAFSNGISYRVQLLNDKMRIYASDMKEVLEYSVSQKMIQRLIEQTKDQITAQKNGEYKPNPMTAKPVIYLYPEKESEISVQLQFNGTLTSTYPTEPSNTKTSCAWTVTASPDGTLTDLQGRNYRYLFWEGVADIDWKQDSGFFVKAEDAEQFLEEKLSALGLNELEQNDFISYWLPVLQRNGESFVTFADEQYTDAAKLTVTPKPDSVLRVQMLISKVNDTNRGRFEKLPQQALRQLKREGFTLVEWGGTDLGFEPNRTV